MIDHEDALLTTEAGRALLAEVAAIERPGPSELSRWRGQATPEVVSAAVRLVEARRRGRIKFAKADQMWLDPIGVQQATAEPVARHKAERFQDAPLVFDLCCGLGGDLIALAAVAEAVVAVDRDPLACRQARWNAQVHGVAEGVQVVQGRAEEIEIPTHALVHIDPDRRVAGSKRPAQMLADYALDAETLIRLGTTGAGGAIKLGPASDFDAHFHGDRFEVELVSLQGECKEATVWTGRLVTCRRRATRLPEGATWTDRDGPLGAYAEARPLEAFLFDPDPALIRSGLLESFAKAHGLGRITEAADFLTGPEPIDSPFLAAFEALETFPADLKLLRRVVAERKLGPLEIKVRAADFRPEHLRVKLRPPGPNPASLLFVGGGRSGPTRAVLARRRPAGA